MRLLRASDLPADCEPVTQHEVGQDIGAIRECPRFDGEPVVVKKAKLADVSGVVRDR